MLVLSRKNGERIVIGEGVTVEVLEVNGQRVRLGVVAPEDVPVHRTEVFQRGQHEPHKPVPQSPAASLEFDVIAGGRP